MQKAGPFLHNRIRRGHTILKTARLAPQRAMGGTDMAMHLKGERTLCFHNKPHAAAGASVVSFNEGAGPLGQHFDVVLEDDLWGEDSFEKAECKMFERAVELSLQKAHIEKRALHCLLGGDLLNQIITANYAARALTSPFLGLYGACSTMAEALLIGALLIDGCYADNCACIASSHFSSAERQYRYPLEMGTTNPPTAQRTVTGAGCTVLKDKPAKDDPFQSVVLTGGTIGKVVDLGVTDANNMGAAMAPPNVRIGPYQRNGANA